MKLQYVVVTYHAIVYVHTLFRSNPIWNSTLFFLPIVLLSLCAWLLNVVGLLCIALLLVCASSFTHVYCFTICILL